MDKIKESFQNVKKDIERLNKELIYLKFIFKDQEKKMNFFLNELLKLVNSSSNKGLFNSENIISNKTENSFFQSNEATNKTIQAHLKALKAQNKVISTGNEGVQADRQTDRQTDRQGVFNKIPRKDPINDAADLLNSLDCIKKEIRLKFKRLTEQEFSVFLIIYQLTEEKGNATYKEISNKLNLTESSIRDYISRLLKKEIPLEKIKVNNKNIKIKVSENLQKIVTLPTILQLREI